MKEGRKGEGGSKQEKGKKEKEKEKGILCEGNNLCRTTARRSWFIQSPFPAKCKWDNLFGIRFMLNVRENYFLSQQHAMTPRNSAQHHATTLRVHVSAGVLDVWHWYAVFQCYLRILFAFAYLCACVACCVLRCAAFERYSLAWINKVDQGITGIKKEIKTE